MSSSESMAEVGPSTTGTAAANPPPPPPPQPHRRPRVREVSSRFMTPVASHSSSFSPLPNVKHQRSSSVQRQRSSSSTEPLGSADENRQSAESSSSSSFFGRCSPQRKQHQPHARAVVKLFKENNGAGGGREFQPPPSKSHRQDTPTVPIAAASSASVSRLRLVQQRSTHISAAARLLQSSGMSSNPNPVESSTISSSSSSSSEGNDGEVSSQPVQSCSPWSLPDVLRSSMPEVDMLPSVRTVSRTSSTPVPNDSSAKLFSASPCSRSLNLPRSNSESSVFHSLKEKPPSSKTGSLKLGGLPLPPVPPYATAAAGGGGGGGKVANNTDSLRKGRKVSGHQEDVHSLRLLYNRYLQWRFANAKAEISGQGQRRETEGALYSLAMRISELRDSATSKRTQLGVLQKMRTLSTILEAQMPYLDEWSAFEGEYSVSLSETIEALLNASLRIPISGNIRVDIREMEEALNSATKLMESIAVNIQSFMPQAEEIEALISDLARLTGGERSLIEECGDVLSSTHKSQVEECSLRSQLIQLQRIRHV